MRARLLVVDDEAPLMEALCRTLEPDGYDVTGCASPYEAIAALRNASYDLLLTDLMMPGMDGIALLRTALEIDPDLVGVLMTGQGTVATAVDAMKVGALDYILKPFNLSAIRPVLTRALSVRRLRTENIRLREAIGIYELSQSIARTLDSRTILESIAEAAFQQSHAHEVLVLVGAPAENALRLAAVRSKDAAVVRRCSVPITEDLVAWADASSEWLSRLDEDTVATPPPLQARGLEERRSRLAIPMRAGGRLAGVLVFEPSAGRSPSLGQIRALSVLASAGATAIEVSMLVERLHRTNDDLRQVAWAASHDLQEPLRMIALYTDLLAARHRGTLDAESNELVSYATEGARRILAMMRDLRAYLEAGDITPAPDTRGDAGRALRLALDDVRHDLAACRGDIRFNQLPTVRMNEAHLVQLFTRLLGNALKFRRPGAAPRVDVSATRDAGVWTLSVADDGIGIDPAYHTQVFDLFRRLNRRDDYAGNGMGLPICRRIVESYGGTLWVESRPDHGARFCFTVPEVSLTD